MKLLSLILALTITLPAASGYERMTNMKTLIQALLNRKEIISTRFEGEPSTEYWSENDVFTFDGIPAVTPADGKELKILTLTDLHFSDYDYRLLLSFPNCAHIKKLAGEVKPDLIVLTGDLVCTESTWNSVRRLTDLMESLGIPWAPVFGNHDDEGNCDLNYLAETMMSSPHCLMKKGDPEMGVGNYLVNVTDKDGSVVETLVMMDSHHDITNEKQNEWFKWVSEGVTRLTGGKAELSLFMHIPLPEYQLGYDEARDSEAEGWRDGSGAFGELHESICCVRGENGAEPSSLFETIKGCPKAKYVFCGHDHMNDFSVTYNGVRLTYLMKLGLGSGFQIGFNGGSVITVGADGITGISHLVFRPFGLRTLESFKSN